MRGCCTPAMPGAPGLQERQDCKEGTTKLLKPVGSGAGQGPLPGLPSLHLTGTPSTSAFQAPLAHHCLPSCASSPKAALRSPSREDRSTESRGEQCEDHDKPSIPEPTAGPPSPPAASPRLPSRPRRRLAPPCLPWGSLRSLSRAKLGPRPCCRPCPRPHLSVGNQEAPPGLPGSQPRPPDSHDFSPSLRLGKLLPFSLCF